MLAEILMVVTINGEKHEIKPGFGISYIGSNGKKYARFVHKIEAGIVHVQHYTYTKSNACRKADLSSTIRIDHFKKQMNILSIDRGVIVERPPKSLLKEIGE